MKYKLLYFLTHLSLIVSGQHGYDNSWVLGDVGGVILSFDISSPEITNVDSNFSLTSGNAAISNTVGELQFFTNGCEIKNKEYQVMSNGDSIGFPEIPFCNTNFNPLANSIVILPSFSYDSIYYVLHIGFSRNELDTSNLVLTKVDISGDNELGEVISKKELIFTDYLSRYGIEITYHKNGKDWWVLIPQFGSNCYHTLLFDEGDFQYDTLQCLGQEWGSDDVQNQHDFSPDGKKYARFSYARGLNIYDFDNSTGLFSNHVNIDFGFTDTVYHTGVIFSPNSRFVYASAYDNVFQYDLDANDVAQSRVKVATLVTPDFLMFPTRFKRGALAPNGKIYIGGRTQYNYLHVIHNPDCKGLLCNLEQYALKLNEFPHFCSQGVPNIPHFKNRPQDINCDTVNIVNSISPMFDKENIFIYPNPVDEYLTVELAGIISDLSNVKIVSVLGQELSSIDLGSIIGNKIQIPMNSLESGMYYLLLFDKQGNIGARKKVIKL